MANRNRYFHIKIDAHGDPDQPHPQVSKKQYDGVNFQADVPCLLKFTNGCPFDCDSNDTLSLDKGDNDEDFNGSEARFPYATLLSLKRPKVRAGTGKPSKESNKTGQFDITVTS